MREPLGGATLDTRAQLSATSGLRMPLSKKRVRLVALLTRAVVVSGLVLADSGLARAQAAADSTVLSRALTFYAQNRLQEALPLFRQAAQHSPADIERQNWLAETERRLGSMDEAVRTARQAAKLAGCSSFAYTVLATAFDPQYSSWYGVSYDSTWSYLHRAVACDARDGNAWLLFWGEALRRRDTKLAWQALRALVTTGFLTPPNLELARWVLQALPPQAIVLAGGDMDTYPLMAVQATEGLRPDVVIVNEPMLALPWYALHFGQQQGLPLPVRAESLAAEDRLGVIPNDLKDSLVTLWRRMATTGILGRPLAFELSTGEQREGSGLGRLRLAGPYWLVVPDSDSAAVDTAIVHRALLKLVPARWRGPTLSAQDRSSVRRASQIPPVLYAVLVAERYASELLKHRQVDAARRAWRGAEALAATAGLATDTIAKYLGGLRAALDSTR